MRTALRIMSSIQIGEEPRVLPVVVDCVLHWSNAKYRLPMTYWTFWGNNESLQVFKAKVVKMDPQIGLQVCVRVFLPFLLQFGQFKKVVNFVIQLRYFMACLLEVNWFPVIKSPFLFFSLLHGKKQRLTTMPSLRKDSNIILSSSELRGNCTPLFLRIAQSATKWRPHHWDLSNHHSEGKKRVFN